jgi:peptide/nickel transport system substrate-binding protein
LTLVRNPHWDPATDPGRIQAVDRWEFKFLQDAPTLEHTIVSDRGQGSTSVSMESIRPPTYKKIAAQDPDRLVLGTTTCTYMWYLDMRKITEIDVRKAVGYAYPYLDAWKAAGYIQGVTISPGTSILPPGTAGRVEYDALGIGGSRTDPDKARELLSRADALGFEITFYYESDDPLHVAEKDQIVKGLEAAGFTVTPIASTITGIGAAKSDYDSPVNVRPGGWCADWPSGGSWFPAQWSGELVGDEGMPNPASFDEPDADAMLQAVLGGPADDAAAGWGAFDKYIEETYYPAVVTGYVGAALIRGSEVGGMHNDSVRGVPTFQVMYVTR